MPVRLLVQVGSWTVLDIRLFQYEPDGGEPAGPGSQLAAGELAETVDAPVGFAVRRKVQR